MHVHDVSGLPLIQTPITQGSPVTPNGAAHLVTGGDAARDGVGLSGVEPVHHSRLAPLLPLGPAFSLDPTVFGDASVGDAAPEGEVPVAEVAQQRAGRQEDCLRRDAVQA